jgi:acetyl-CoA/propionyl-CoA carboxylase biotin carboxyl carrier protein
LARGHAIEARVYAEDPARDFLPAPGRLAAVAWPVGPGIRVDAGYANGDEVPPDYDAMLAKVVVTGSDRDAALAGLEAALRRTIVAGVPTNLPWLRALAGAAPVISGAMTTGTAATVPSGRADPRPALLGAVAHTLDGSRAATDPWSAIGPFRLAGAGTLSFHGDDWEETARVERRGDGWLLGTEDAEAPLRWWRDQAGVWTVAAGDEVVRVAVVEREGGLEIAGEGGRWLIASGPRPAAGRERRQAAADGRVRAPMPGRILKVAVAPGDRVTPEQPLVTLTAMKMELSCVAPAAGVVRQVRCSAGEQVAAHQLLIELELDPPPGAEA